MEPSNIFIDSIIHQILICVSYLFYIILDGNEMKNAIIETFTHRETGFDDIVAFDPDFTEDSVRQGRWRAFIKKKKAMMKVEFAEAIEQSKKLLMPIVEVIEQKKEFNRQWNKERRDWI